MSLIVDKSSPAAEVERLQQLPAMRVTLDRLRREVPLYRRLHPAAVAGHDAWEGLPFVTKSDLKFGFPRNFLGDAGDLEALLERDEVELDHTSGTSGEQLPLLLGAGWWPKQELRALRLNSEVRSHLDGDALPRRALLAAPACSAKLCYLQRPTFGERTDGRILSLSLNRFPWLAGADEWERIADELDRWEPVFLDADPVYAAAFARFCRARGRRFPSLRFVVASYEYVSVTHRRLLEGAWGLPVVNLYGSTETGHLLVEDRAGRMRPVDENAFLELVDADASGVGDLVVTGLTNPFMPLVRYRIGDLAERRITDGKPEFLLHGRARDALAAGSRRVTTRQADQCFVAAPSICHYRLTQKSDGSLSLQYLADEPLGPAEEERLRDGFGRLFPESSLGLRREGALLGEPSGKFRLTAPFSHDIGFAA